MFPARLLFQVQTAQRKTTLQAPSEVVATMCELQIKINHAKRHRSDIVVVVFAFSTLGKRLRSGVSC